ncbi:DUF2637 domain-containing protein [Streptomyces sp. RPT161]|uniref:DUF2637 domain-containing protein n=1 Tax=Streptomyces sp. RPT161 TaxID=3015993 RepID=UPI0022B89727|nr:DUF2637 domain-containing protein [Streptomyces sp. RPT161]
MRPAAPPAIPGTAAIRAGIILLGAIGFALSYDALRQMAAAVHIRGLLTYLFPLVIDGFIAIGVGALLILRTAPLHSRLYVWALVGIATATSIWANALHAIRLNQQAPRTGLHLDNPTVGALSAIAPLALAGAVHLYLVIRRHLTANNAVAKAPYATSAAEAAMPEPIHPVVREKASEEASGDAVASAKVSDEPVPEVKAAIAVEPIAKAVPQRDRRNKGGRKTTVPDDVLLATARALRARTGRVPRTALEGAIRDKGYTIRRELAQQAADAVMAELDSAMTTIHAA